MPKSRAEAVKLINEQIDSPKRRKDKIYRHHYGKQELKQLMDFIYESKPTADSELIIDLSEYKSNA